MREVCPRPARRRGRVVVLSAAILAATLLPVQAGGWCGPRGGLSVGFGGGWGGGCGPGWGYRPGWAYGPGWGPGWGCGPSVAIGVVPAPVFVQRTVVYQRGRTITLVPDPALNEGGSIYASEEVRTVQAALNARGFNAGAVDGVYGQRTRQAIAAYQQARGVPVTGDIDPALVNALSGNPATDAHGSGYGATYTPSQPTVTPPPTTNNSNPPAPNTGTKPQSAVTTKYPNGIPVDGKPGYVKSPYAENAGLVDVRGFSSGTMVRCPYTSKIFIVP